MLYKILADLIMVVHFVWVLFVLLGFILTLAGFWWKKFFDKWLFRSIHVAGILLVGVIAAWGKLCPLTLWENALREKYNPVSAYEGSCIIYYVQKLLYPDINPLVIRTVTTFVTLFSIIIFIIKPPEKIRRIFKCKEV